MCASTIRCLPRAIIGQSLPAISRANLALISRQSSEQNKNAAPPSAKAALFSIKDLFCCIQQSHIV
jgi:hypothetical protein